MENHEILLGLLIFGIALLYSTVGHAGASGYLAAMALFSIAPAVMKPTALLLNILVSIIGTVRFYRAGHFSWRIFWPFAVASIPLAYLGGRINLPVHIYKQLVGIVLILSACRLLWTVAVRRSTAVRPVPIPAALLVGAAIGFLSGLTGVGGGIFLSPVLLLAGWAETRQTAAVSAAFILVNSIAGLAGQAPHLESLTPAVWAWGAVAIVGGFVGSGLGSRRLSVPVIRLLLAAVLVLAGAKLMLERSSAHRDDSATPPRAR